MQRRTSIRQKLAVAVAVPLVALVVVTTLEVMASRRQADEVREQSRLAHATLGPDGLLAALQEEALLASSTIAGVDPGEGLTVSNNEEARQQTDEAIDAFRRRTAEAGDRTTTAYAPALDGLDALAAVRESVDAYRGEAIVEAVDIDNPGAVEQTDGFDAGSNAYRQYTALIEPFYDANGRIADAVDDTTLRNGTNLVNLAARQNDVAGNMLRATAISMFTDGGIDPATELPEISELLGTFDEYNDKMRSLATGPYAPMGDTLFADERVETFRTLIAEAAQGQDVQASQLLDARISASDSPYTAFRNDAAEVLEDEAASRDAGATARERWFLVLATLVLGLAFVSTWLTSRSITRPLRSLTRQARDMAERRLPGALREILDRPLGEDVTIPVLEPVHVETRDEVIEVADALNTVESTAVDLAVEQAVLRRNIADAFLNLGRRNQNLLSRQLDFITELESQETDPDTLASLFRLDHLATRMRRNAESLLVLAGGQPPRTWSAPIQVNAIIRAAFGEVEGYERVQLGGIDQATVMGSAAADLAHLVAELLENALAFSPPTEAVRVRGMAAPHGYVLTIIDRGVGMTPSDLEAANRRLAGTESFTVAPSKYLGHYVAGRLAGAHAVTVRVDSPGNRGLVATIVLPPSLLVDMQVPSIPAPGAPVGVGVAAASAPGEPAGWLPRSPYVPAIAPAPGRPGTPIPSPSPAPGILPGPL
jgi:signal transduction histidine kinase